MIRYKRKGLYCTLWMGIFSFLILTQLSGQEKFIVSGGMGLPEFLNINVRFQAGQSQFKLGAGTFPLKDEKLVTTSGTFYYHFAGSSGLSNTRPWYGRIGLDYLRDETSTVIDKYLYLNVRIGRDFNLSKRLGIEVDAGAIFEMYNDTERKVPPSGWYLDIDFPVMMSVGVALFYRF